VHRIRFVIILLALALVLAGWPFVGKVAELRVARESSEAARAAFGRWHGISLSLNLATLVLATAGLALAACLPPPRLTGEHDSL
jgi:hypothetical protein